MALPPWILNYRYVASFLNCGVSSELFDPPPLAKLGDAWAKCLESKRRSIIEPQTDILDVQYVASFETRAFYCCRKSRSNFPLLAPAPFPVKFRGGMGELCEWTVKQPRTKSLTYFCRIAAARARPGFL